MMSDDAKITAESIVRIRNGMPDTKKYHKYLLTLLTPMYLDTGWAKKQPKSKSPQTADPRRAPSYRSAQLPPALRWKQEVSRNEDDGIINLQY